MNSSPGRLAGILEVQEKGIVKLDLSQAADLIGRHVLVETICDSETIPEELFWHNIQSLMVLGSDGANAREGLMPEEGILIC